MKIIVLGGDGFCGWPTSLKLAKRGHEVLIVDNLSRRYIDNELRSNSLTQIMPLETRVETAKNLVGNISWKLCDVAQGYHKLISIVNQFQPDAIVHFAEQRAAPYSMISQRERIYTIDNNINATHNVLNAIVEIKKDIHLVHLGTMGVYGYSKDFGEIPEGYLNVKVNSTERDVDILYPTNPGSVYHLTKSMDQLMFQFYKKNWDLNITDLHQGIVWGTETSETKIHQYLVNRFDYDGIYGTVLNRFISQAAAGVPLTVYGVGGQKRAFIHIEDTANCVCLAVENPPNTERVRIFNQVAEVRSVKELAEIINNKYGSEIKFYDNPRKEMPINDLSVKNEGLKSLGFEPILLNESLINDVKFIAEELKSNFNKNNVMTSPRW